MQDGTGDIDRIVEGEHLHDLGRRIVGMRQPARQFGPGHLFDFIGQPADHLAENANLLFVELAFDENIGRVPQRFRPAFRRATRNRVVQVFQSVTDFSHRAIQ